MMFDMPDAELYALLVRIEQFALGISYPAAPVGTGFARAAPAQSRLDNLQTGTR